MLQLTLAQARRSIGRLAAAGLAIAIGTAFVAATLLASDLMTRTARDAMVTSLAQADLVITGAPLSDADVAAVGAVPDVAVADPQLEGFLQFSAAGRVAYQPYTAVAGDPRLQPLEVVEGRLPEDGEVAVPRAVADRLGLAVDNTVEVTFSRWVPLADGTDEGDGEIVEHVEALRVAGVADDPTGAFAATDGAVLVTAGDARRWAQLGDEEVRVDRMLLLLAPGADLEEVRTAVGAALPGEAGHQVRTRAEQAEVLIAARSGQQDLLTALVLGFAAVALIVAGLVIANTFSVLVAQRTRQLALLRCVGATARQLRRSVSLEALLLGTAASLVGIAVGTLLAQGALLVLRNAAPHLPLPEVVALRPLVVVVPLLAGVLVTLVAARTPARAAARVSPLAAMRPADAPSVRAPGSRRRLRTALVFTAGGLVLLVVAATVGGALSPLLGLALGIPGGLLSFVGVLLGSVFFVPRLLGRAGGVLARRDAPAAVLAAANTVRNPQRTAVTSAALMIGVTLVAMMSTGAATARNAFDRELDREFPVDLEVAAVDEQDVLAASDLAAVGELDGVDRAVGLRSVVGVIEGGHEGLHTTVAALDPADATAVVRGGLVDELGPDTVLVPASMAELAGIEDGASTTIGLAGDDGSLVPDASTSVVARVGDLPGHQLLVTSETLARFAPDAEVTRLWVRLSDHGAAPAVVEAVQERFSTQVVEVGGPALERAMFDRIIDGLLAVVVGLLGVAVVIALVGVANTLSLSVIERRHESATLRAIGLTRRQLRSTLAIEGVLIAGSGAVVGALLGTLYGWAGTRAVLGAVADGIPLTVPWRDLGLVLVVALGAGALASVLPGRAAARTSPVAALATE
ncbi:ABC transporter permease [Egicoccus halophilus]|uniref:ABC transporter permease n=1 Tax=Egicoccus halophilus TaxID=1670830 RepID=A0A8J3EUU3_9ACTN|nr:FtsX-like permease family protein [Egicoccus halophilus]GGI08386.1 ABC transporter permease [Egicoccus halophilus]